MLWCRGCWPEWHSPYDADPGYASAGDVLGIPKPPAFTHQELARLKSFTLPVADQVGCWDVYFCFAASAEMPAGHSWLGCTCSVLFPCSLSMGGMMLQSGEECIVCQEPEQLQRVIQLPCEHRFHAACLRQWLIANPSCPKCVPHPAAKIPSLHVFNACLYIIGGLPVKAYSVQCKTHEQSV